MSLAQSHTARKRGGHYSKACLPEFQPPALMPGWRPPAVDQVAPLSRMGQ